MTRRKRTLLIVAAVAVGLCALCMLIGLLLPKTPEDTKSATIEIPAATEPPITPSATFPPSATLPPATFTPSPIPTSTPTPTITPTPSATPVCICAYDAYDCAGFTTHAEAQACFNDCIRVYAGDIHLLDSDGDGEACESLP